MCAGCRGRTLCSFFLPSPISPPQRGITIVALQAWRVAGEWPLQGGKGLGQLVERAAHDAHIVGVAQVGDEGCLGRLVFHVAPQMGPPETATQALLGVGEKLFQDIVGARHDRHDWTARRTHHRVAAELLAIAVQIVQQEGFGRIRRAVVRQVLEKLAQSLVVALEVGGQRLQRLRLGVCAGAGRGGRLAVGQVPGGQAQHIT